MKKNIAVIFLCALALSCTASLSSNYIPLSQVAQNSNLDIFWEPNTQRIYLTKGEFGYIFEAGKNYVTLDAQDEKIFFMPLPALRYNGEVYISKDFDLPEVQSYPNTNNLQNTPIFSDNKDDEQLKSLIDIKKENVHSELLSFSNKKDIPISLLAKKGDEKLEKDDEKLEKDDEKLEKDDEKLEKDDEKLEKDDEKLEKDDDTIKLKSAQKMYDVIIDAGHGGKDPGASNLDFIEKNLNLQIAKEISANLQGSLSLKFTRKTDIHVPIKDRILASYNAKLLVSIHFNSAVSEVSGFEIWVSFKNFEKSILLAKILEKQIEEHTSLKNRGIRYNDFQVISQVQIPAILIECGFVTNKEDMKWFNDSKNIQLFSRLVADSIKKFFEKEGL